MGSNPCRRLLLLGIAHPVTGPPFRYREFNLTRFSNDYVANDMAKVRKFDDGLKLSIRGKIVGFLLQDMDSMVRKAFTTEREIDDTRSIRDAGVSQKKRENQSSSSSGNK